VRVAFFGLPLGALLLAKDGHPIVYAGVLREKGLRRLMAFRAPGRVEIAPDLSDGSTVERLRASDPELIVTWFWPQRVPARVLRLAPCLGVHPSLLPRHRGPDPYFWAIDNGDSTTGVTAHLLGVEYDTGPILAQRALAIEPNWNAWQLARALDRPGLLLMREMVRAYGLCEPPTPRPQDESMATQAPQPVEGELAVRWSWTAERIERRVRAAAPWPGAWTEIGDQCVVLVRVRSTADAPRTLLPGEAAVRADGIAVVRAGEGAIELLEGRAEDDETPIAARDFAALVARARVDF
jgi:methionyl-tRNA formyltransferase